MHLVSISLSVCKLHTFSPDFDQSLAKDNEKQRPFSSKNVFTTSPNQTWHSESLRQNQGGGGLQGRSENALTIFYNAAHNESQYHALVMRRSDGESL